MRQKCLGFYCLLTVTCSKVSEPIAVVMLNLNLTVGQTTVSRVVIDAFVGKLI